MSVTLQEFIDKAVEQAALGVDSQTIDLEGVAESLLPQVFEEVTRRFSDAGKTLPRLTKTLSFTNGLATLSSDVLTSVMSNAVLYDPSDSTSIYSLVPYWDDFIQVYDTRLGYFTIRGGASIYVIQPGDEYEDGAGLTGDLKLVVPGVPALPSAASTTIDASTEFTNAALDLLVERLRGGMPERVAA